MLYTNFIRKTLLSSAMSFAMAAGVSAASVTYPAASSVFAGGTTTFEFSPLVLGAMDTGSQTIQGGYGDGTANSTYDEDHYYLKASFSTPNTSVTLDSDTHQVLAVAATGGVTQKTPKLRGVKEYPGSLTITNLNIDVVNKKVYADLIGDNGLGTLPQVHLWNVTDITTAITRVGETDGLPNLDITQTLTGIYMTSDGMNAHVKALNLVGIGKVAFEGVNTPLLGGFGTLTIVNRFNVDPAYFTAAVPEPSTWALTMVGLLGIGLTARSRRTCPSAAA